MNSYPEFDSAVRAERAQRAKREKEQRIRDAAPELLNACIAALSQLTEDREEYLDSDIEQLRQAIEKASPGTLAAEGLDKDWEGETE